MEMKEALKTVVNSALLTCENHEIDDAFISCEPVEIERNMARFELTPAGVSWNMPFTEYKSRQVAFAFYKDDEIYWCHMPENCLRVLLMDYYGMEESKVILAEMKGSEK